nr:unnamed protein product [Digitaria exilis]
MAKTQRKKEAAEAQKKEAVSYEEQRRRQVEANKRKLEELQLHHLSAAVREAATAAAKPSPEVPDFGRKVRRTYGSGRKDLENRVYATDEERSYAITKAEELEEELGSAFPIFVKPMTQSHVTGGFWLGLPTPFCRKYLPKHDETITLEDEEGDEFETLYLARKIGLSAGWRGFSIEHELVDGDCLVFQLIERTKFKVSEIQFA